MSSNTNPLSPDYSPLAQRYAQSRPHYPASLFSTLASLVNRRHLAWDCATGNGQAAVSLAQHFDHVIATDMSEEQIAHALQNPGIEYRVALASESGLEGGSVDLVTVATAIHWFDLEKFYQELKRVTRPGSMVAAWSYHIGHVRPPFDGIFGRLYRDVLAEYFPGGAQLVEDRYETLHLPGEAVKVPDFEMKADWTLDQMYAFVRSWSATDRYIRERGEDPVGLIAQELEALWGERSTVRTVEWPLYIKVARM